MKFHENLSKVMNIYGNIRKYMEIYENTLKSKKTQPDIIDYRGEVYWWALLASSTRHQLPCVSWAWAPRRYSP